MRYLPITATQDGGTPDLRAGESERRRRGEARDRTSIPRSFRIPGTTSFAWTTSKGGKAKSWRRGLESRGSSPEADAGAGFAAAAAIEMWGVAEKQKPAEEGEVDLRMPARQKEKDEDQSAQGRDLCNCPWAEGARSNDDRAARTAHREREPAASDGARVVAAVAASMLITGVSSSTTTTTNCATSPQGAVAPWDRPMFILTLSEERFFPLPGRGELSARRCSSKTCGGGVGTRRGRGGHQPIIGEAPHPLRSGSPERYLLRARFLGTRPPFARGQSLRRERRALPLSPPRGPTRGDPSAVGGKGRPHQAGGRRRAVLP